MTLQLLLLTQCLLNYKTTVFHYNTVELLFKQLNEHDVLLIHDPGHIHMIHET